MIKIGVVGCGHWGINFIRNFEEIKESKIIIVSDVNEERLNFLKVRFPHLKFSLNYQDVLYNPQVEAVVIATPATTHFKIATQALYAGKHILVEKPLTISIEDSKRLIDLAYEKGKILMVGHTFCFNKGIHKLKEYISISEFGEIYYLHAVRTNLGPIRKDVNVLYDLVPHDIAIFLYLIEQMPLEIQANGRGYLKENIEDFVSLSLSFPNRIMANVYASWIEPCKVRKITVIGSKKMIVFDDVNNLETIKIYDKGVIKEKSYNTFGEFQLILRDGDVSIPKVELKEPLKIECQHFLKCIKENKQPITNGENGLKVGKILAAAQESLHKQGTPIEVR